MSKRKVDVILKGHDQVSGVFRRAGASANRLFSSITGAVGMLGGLIGGIAIGAFVKKAIGAYAEQEKSVRLLEDALRTVGNTSAQELKRLERYAAGLQQVTDVGDETIMQLQALAIQMTGQTGPTIDRMTKAALGMSHALGIDARAAMLLLAKAQKGETASLSRYGIILDQTMSKQEKFNAVLEIGEKQFATFSERSLDFGGQMKQVWNAVGDTMEIIGGKIARAFSEGEDGSQSLLESIEDTITAVNDLMLLQEQNRRVLEKYGQEAKQTGALSSAWRAWADWWQEVGDRSAAIVNRGTLEDMNAATAEYHKQVEKVNAAHKAGVTTLDEWIERREALAAEFGVLANVRPPGVETTAEAAGRELAEEAAAMPSPEEEKARRKEMLDRLKAEATEAIKEAEMREKADDARVEANRETQEEIERLRIEITQKGFEKELSLLELKHNKEIEMAKRTGLDIEAIKERQMLEAARLFQQRGIEAEVGGGGALRAPALAALEARALSRAPGRDGFDPAQQTAQNTEQMAKSSEQQNKTLADLLAEVQAIIETLTMTGSPVFIEL